MLCKILCNSTTTMEGTSYCVSVATVVTSFVLGGVSARHGNRNSCRTFALLLHYFSEILRVMTSFITMRLLVLLALLHANRHGETLVSAL
jgi:hypothetical protein